MCELGVQKNRDNGEGREWREDDLQDGQEGLHQGLRPS